jgi:hypothetical protein
MCTRREPSKESVRRWLQDELKRRRPPPSLEQIRREIGWSVGRASGLTGP